MSRRQLKEHDKVYAALEKQSKTKASSSTSEPTSSSSAATALEKKRMAKKSANSKESLRQSIANERMFKRIESS